MAADLVNTIRRWTTQTEEGGCATLVVETPDVMRDVAARLAVDSDQQVRLVPAKRCQSTKALFDTWSCALGFPEYFGENWMAFDECIGDREISPRVPTIVLVVDAETLLANEPPNSRSRFLRTVASLALGRAASSYQSLPDHPFPSLWVLLCFRSLVATKEFVRSVTVRDGRIDHL